MNESLHLKSIARLAPLIDARRVSVAELVDACLAQIERRNPDLNAFIDVTADSARRDARQADAEIAAGRYRGPLHGIPISIKDLIDVRGLATTAASRVRPLTPAVQDAPVVDRLRAAGVVLLGKCNLHEFAFGTTGEDSAFGPTRNPHDLTRSPGGSSGGSAAAVATGMSCASVGTDTGGSIRIPSAACGVVGLKPTFDELPCEGIVPLSRSLDHVGPLARSVQDAWLMYRCMAGDLHPAPLDRHPEDGVRTLRLGLPRGYFLDCLDPEVRLAFDGALDRLRRAGCHIEQVEIPHARTIPAVYLHAVMPEAFAYHARTLRERPEDYTPGVRLRLEMGHYILAEDYVRAQRGRDVLRREVDDALRDCHALVLPTLPIPAPRLGVDSVTVGDVSDSVRSVTLRLTQLFNLTGHPAVTLPCGRIDAGLPCGLQLVGAPHRTGELMTVAFQIEPHVTGDARSSVDR